MSIEATRIYERMCEAYSSCSSYRDEGTVTTTFYHPRRVERRPFTTRFVRGTGFLFEFRRRRGEDDWDQYAVWSENGRGRSWWSVRPDRDDSDSLAHALAGATGVSGGSAYRVPHLLMPEMQGDRPAHSQPEVVLIEVSEASVAGCVVIEGAMRTGGTEQIWIDRFSHLIRRVVEPRRSMGPPPTRGIETIQARYPQHAAEIARRLGVERNWEAEETTTYNSAFNVAIESADLRFVPPGVS